MHVQRTFRPVPASAGSARRFVGEAIRGHGFDTDCAQLLTSELVANAVRHAGTDMLVSVHVENHELHISVEDGDARIPEAREVAPDKDSGRGLLLVARLASAWGVERTISGKRIWFQLGVL